MSGAPTGYGQPLAATLRCMLCDHTFTSAVALCPRCYGRLQEAAAAGDPVAQRGVSQLAEPLPPALPWGPLLAGAVSAFVVAFIAFLITWESGYWLVIAFPGAIGAAGGAVMALALRRRGTICRSAYFLYPLVIGFLAFASTFFWEYEFTMNELEDMGYDEARDIIGFGTFLELKAESGFTIARRYGAGAEYEANNPSDAYLLWTVEAAAAAGGGYWGWRRTHRWVTQQQLASIFGAAA